SPLRCTPPLPLFPYTTLFRSHNAGRSQMAAGWLRHLAGDRIEVRSAGSMPVEQINPVAVEAMLEVGIDITAEQPKVLTAEACRTDRKSTRLNSSHVSISYAVF